MIPHARPLDASSAVESAIPEAARQVLCNRVHWGFDVAALEGALGAGGPGLLATLFVVLARDRGLFDSLPLREEAVVALFSAVEGSYKAVPYHNATHAADVLHTVYFMTLRGGLTDTLPPLDLLALFSAAAMHDVAHPGLNNHFHVVTESPLAVRFENVHVLEQFHLETFFGLMERPGCDLLAGLPLEQRDGFRALMRSLVLITDISSHEAFVASIAAAQAAPGGLVVASRDREIALKMVLKSADISNPARHIAATMRWTRALMLETFAQGDRERELGLELSHMGDRGVNVPECQVSFIDNIVEPLFSACAAFLPAVSDHFLPQLRENRAMWVRLDEEGKRLLDELPYDQLPPPLPPPPQQQQQQQQGGAAGGAGASG